MTHDMTLRGALVVSFGFALGCYGNPKIGGHDGGPDGTAGSGGAGTGGSDAAGNDGAAGVGGGGARGGHGGSTGGGQGGSFGGGQGGAAGGGRGGSSVGGQGGLSGGAGSAGTGGVSVTGGAAGIGGGGGTADGAAGGGAGACNPACDAIHTCTGGRCLLADAQQCVTASQCASSACNPFYKDVDADGYGTGQAVGFCTLTAPPIGYAAQTGDCCDDATNISVAKLIHPGADFQPTSADGICNGITWDYDCSGTIETDPQTVACGGDYPNCSSTIVNRPETACGPGGVEDCSCTSAGNGTNGSCLRACSGHAGTVACK
jgi:hypothetical protein